MSSSGGGLAQLVAYGAQDVYLTGKPQQSIWRQKYMRNTNCAIESIQQTLAGDVNYGSSATATLSRSGDLICGLMAQVTLTRGTGNAYYPAEALFKNIELKIGGQQIDYLYSNWNRAYTQLYYDAKQLQSYQDAVDFGNEVQGQQRTFFFPIPLFFSNVNTQLALPLIALQYHEVELKFDFASASEMNGVDTSIPPVVKLYADYVFLDSPERIWFAQNPHEYLITQLQYQSMGIQFSNSAILRYSIPLNFNHPTKMITWVTTQPGYPGQFTALGGETDDNTAAPIYSAVLQLNGRERFSERPGKYFKNAQPWLAQNGNFTSSGIYSYHFGMNNTLNVNTTYTSGTLNFSE